MASTEKRVPGNGRNPDEVHLGHYLRKVPQATSSFHPRQPDFGFAARPRPKCRVASLTADREKAAACAAALALTRITSLLAATNR